jgi:hypothetical protein
MARPTKAQIAERLASEDAAVRSAARWPGLTDWQRIFLDAWREGSDRLKALEAAGKDVDDFDAALETSPKFASACSRVEREFIVQLEDAQVRSAKEGKSAGSQKLALEAFSTRYAKKPAGGKPSGPRAGGGGKMSGVKNWSEKAERTWGSIFESTRPIARKAEA